VRQFVHTPPLAAGLVTLAWTRQATGDPYGALDAIGEADERSPGPSGLLNPVPAQRARLVIAQGDIDAAARWTTEQCLAFDDEPDYPREPAHLVLARVLIAHGRLDRARALLARLATAAANQHRTGSLIEIHAVRSVALAAAEEHNEALDELAQALRLACPQGHVRVFTDEGAPMAHYWAVSSPLNAAVASPPKSRSDGSRECSVRSHPQHSRMAFQRWSTR